MPPDLALLSTLTGSNYPCLEVILIVPKVFEPLKFYCILSDNLTKRKMYNTWMFIFPGQLRVTHMSIFFDNDDDMYIGKLLISSIMIMRH